MTDKKMLRGLVAPWLTEHPDSTSAEIARGIGEDEWDVQHAVLYMVNDGIATQVGKRRLPDEGTLRPVYRMTTEVKKDGSH